MTVSSSARLVALTLSTFVSPGITSGVQSSMVNLKSASSNMRSFFENPLVTRTCRPKFPLAGWPAPFQPLLFVLYISAVLGSFPRTINQANGVSSSTSPSFPSQCSMFQSVQLLRASWPGIAEHWWLSLMWPVHTGMWLSIPTISPYLGCSGVGSTLSIWFSCLGCVRRRLFPTSSPGRFSLASASHMTTKHPEFVGALN